MKYFPALIALILSCSCTIAKEITMRDSQGMTCYVYLPDPIDPDKTYQVVVGVHGAKGKGNGAAGLKSWANRGDVIVLGPSFNTSNDDPYQYAGGVHDSKLVRLFKEVGKTYKIREKMFLHGFSGGSQFVHRFAMNKPKYVCGVSAHSGGTWASDGYGKIKSSAKNIPFAISCGENDTKKSFSVAPLGRLAWYKKFAKAIDRRKYCYIGNTWPNQGHGMSSGAKNLLQQCFQLATGLPGASATQKVSISPEWKNLDNIPKFAQNTEEKTDNNKTPTSAGNSTIQPQQLARITRAAFAQADKKIIDDNKLITFLEKYPATLWKEQEGSTKLLEQCTAAAKRWRKKAIQAGKFKGNVEAKFDKFTAGLEVE